MKIIQEKKQKEEKEEIKGDDLEECLICGWKFFKELSFKEKNSHINACIEGNGEKNKKELISTYREVELLRMNEEAQNNDDNNNNNDNDERNGE